MAYPVSTRQTLALLGGPPARVHQRPRFPVFTERAQERVVALLRDGDSVGLSKEHPLIAAAENELASWHGVPHCLGTSTGHAALHSALIGLEVTDGDEVITTPYSWGASASCILHNGAVPVFVDVDPDTGLLDPDAIEGRVGKRTTAILVTHIYGQPADLTRLRAIADRHGLALIEDGSQAHGAEHRGRLVGSFGDAAGFSAMGGKLLATSEAGFMLTPRDDVYWKAALSCQHAGGTEHPGRAAEPGFPAELLPFIDSLNYTYRLSTINAILLVEQLGKLDAENAARTENRQFLVDALHGVGSVTFPTYPVSDEPVFHMVTTNFVPEVAGIHRDTYARALQAEGVPVFSYIRTPLHHAQRLSMQYTGPRVMWSRNLEGARRDAIDIDLPGCDHKVARSVEMTWNYIERDPDAMLDLAAAFIKVEEHLPALREYEWREGLAPAAG